MPNLVRYRLNAKDTKHCWSVMIWGLMPDDWDYQSVMKWFHCHLFPVVAAHIFWPLYLDSFLVLWLMYLQPFALCMPTITIWLTCCTTIVTNRVEHRYTAGWIFPHCTCTHVHRNPSWVTLILNRNSCGVIWNPWYLWYLWFLFIKICYVQLCTCKYN